MRIFSLIPVFALLVTAVAGVSLPPRDDDCGSEIGCELAQSISKRGVSLEHPARAVPGLTNAELARRGLPPNDPILRRDPPDHRPKPSPQPSPKPQPPPKYTGNIAVKRKRDGAVLGYVSKDLLNTGQYRYDARCNALIVSFTTDMTGPDPQINLTPKNSNFKGPFLGLVQGRFDVDSVLAPGSFQYTYLANTNPTPPGSPPANVGNSYIVPGRTSESAVWTYDPATELLSPLWVNPDKTTPESDFFVQNTAIFTGGDEAAFNVRFPAPTTLVVFEFVPL